MQRVWTDPCWCNECEQTHVDATSANRPVLMQRVWEQYRVDAAIVWIVPLLMQRVWEQYRVDATSVWTVLLLMQRVWTDPCWCNKCEQTHVDAAIVWTVPLLMQRVWTVPCWCNECEKTRVDATSVNRPMLMQRVRTDPCWCNECEQTLLVVFSHLIASCTTIVGWTCSGGKTCLFGICVQIHHQLCIDSTYNLQMHGLYAIWGHIQHICCEVSDYIVHQIWMTRFNPNNLRFCMLDALKPSQKQTFLNVSSIEIEWLCSTLMICGSACLMHWNAHRSKHFWMCRPSKLNDFVQPLWSVVLRASCIENLQKWRSSLRSWPA